MKLVLNDKIKTIMEKIYLLILFMSIFVLNINAQITYIHCEQLIDEKNDKVMKEMTIVIQENKITAVNKGYTKFRNERRSCL